MVSKKVFKKVKKMKKSKFKRSIWEMKVTTTKRE